MLHILLIRSCETEYDQQGRIQGTLDIPLSADGLRDSQEAVAELKSETIDAVYSSPCQSALFLAETLGKELDIKQKTLDGLHNLDLGLWQGMLIDDVKAKQPKVYRQWQEQPETVCPPEGETVRDVKARIAAVLSKLIKKNKGEGQIAIVVPEPLTAILRHIIRLDDLGNLWQSTNGKASPRWERIPVEPELAGSQ